jgi:predicted  nucleic acid-binding Zn-ribbon protein
MAEDIKNEVSRLISKLEEVEKVLRNITDAQNNLKYSLSGLESKIEDMKYEVRNIGK